MKQFMFSIHLWNLWFGWAGEFAGRKNTFFGCKLTYSREFSVSIRFRNVMGGK
jgi:hypothetical protein